MQPFIPPGLGDGAIGRRTLLAGLGALALAPAATPALASPAWAAGRLAQSPAFLAIGDWGRRGDPVQRAVARGMGVAAREVGSAFVLAAGDNFYPGGVSGVDDPHWRESFEGVYADPALQTPWCAALGNHDYRGVPQAQIDYARRSRRWRMPGRYYAVPGASLGAPEMDLFVIDTAALVDQINPDERFQQLCRGHWWMEDPDPQVAWLRGALGRSRAPWKIVMGHHGIFSGVHGDSPVLIARIAPLLEAFGVQAYVHGHDHDLQHIRRGPVDYVCVGAGAAGERVRPIEGTRFCLGRPGFASFSLAPDRLKLDFRGPDGGVVYTAQIERARPGPTRGLVAAI